MSEIEKFTGHQIAAARALLGMSQAQLSEIAHISVQTLRRMEGASGPAPGFPNNVRAVKQALEAAGVTFFAEGEPSLTGGPGVRLTASPSPED